MTYILRRKLLSYLLTIISQRFINGVTNITHLTSFYTNRGSYLSARVLLNLVNELRKGDKMRGLSSIVFTFSQRVYNKLNNTCTRSHMLESIYHMTLRLRNLISGVKRHYAHNVVFEIISKM